jgi:Glycosyl hydrolases family 2, sugar binding domain
MNPKTDSLKRYLSVTVRSIHRTACFYLRHSATRAIAKGTEVVSKQIPGNDAAYYEASDASGNRCARITMMLEQSCIASGTSLAGPVSLDLSGNMWTLRGDGPHDSIRTSVPSSNFADLVVAGKIPYPFFGENNDKVKWVAEKGSFFERVFEVPDHLFDKSRMELICEGLDTLATIWLNGNRIGDSNNMFRTWHFDIRRHLRRGTNHLLIGFEPLTSYVRYQRAAYRQKYGIDLSNELMGSQSAQQEVFVSKLSPRCRDNCWLGMSAL